MSILTDLPFVFVPETSPLFAQDDQGTPACLVVLVQDAKSSAAQLAQAAQATLHALPTNLRTVVAQAVQADDLGVGESAVNKTLKLYAAVDDRPEAAAGWCLVSVAKEASPKALYEATLAAATALPSKGVHTCSVFIPALMEVAADELARGAHCSAVLRALELASYVYTATKPEAKAHAVRQWRVLDTSRHATQAQTGFARAMALAQGVRLARELGNRPPNSATPTFLAEVAQDLATRSGHTRCTVLDRAAIVAEGMGAFAAVAQGSEQEPRFIVLEYLGPKAAADSAPLVLVGKGITFDSGGISLKPGADMDYMKYDMNGAASVLGAMATITALQAPLHVVALIPTCENLPSGRAVKPSDVVTSHSGQTIEILNTDAEGRLILCDALSYAQRFQPQAVIDVATLTGACVIALGGVRAGMYASDDALAAQLLAAGEAAFDPCWRMPLDDDYAEGLKSKFADVANIAGRAGGSITAAKFLQRFTKDYAWAHLDIAGVAWKEGAAKGSTARPVSLLVHYVLDHAHSA